MLLQLSIRNLALIDEMTIDFAPGMNVMTGETGAGKSIVVDAVNLVLGERADRDLIANGQSKARVEAVFDIADNQKVRGILADMELESGEDTASISRELTTAGKNICRINGTVVPLQTLRQVSSQLLDIHGQHEHQLLLDSRNHVAYLDEYAGDDVRTLLEQTAKAYASWRGCAQKLSRLRRSVAEREQRIDMLRFQLEELKAARLIEDEEDELERQKVFYRNAGKIMSAFDEACDLLDSGAGRGGSSAVELLREGVRALTPVAALDSRYEAVYARLDGLCYEVEDAVAELTDLREEMDYDEQEAERVESRLDLLRRLNRKYGATTREMIRYRDKVAAELGELEDSDEAMERLEKEYRQSTKALKEISAGLTRAREEAARRFEKSIEAQLHDLGMKNARLAMHFAPMEAGEKLTDRFSAQGVDRIEMMFCANLGQTMKPLARVASGGELSRIMLALKNLSAQKPGIPRSMVFDEIDTGISGRMAQVVSEKMSQIGDHHQVICVTHLPQIAAMADEQFLVRKGDEGGVTRTEVIRLDSAQRAQEIARMVGGAACESESSIRHAVTMLEEADERKRALREMYRA
ncbi:MAG: DNA repair protein RecN [Clostridia bacterium]|nr:DNA repair protein RecN [Clostridia bacterium]MBQ4609031.1 DNA repair protein RecN [Clostridia bacterium]MBQ6857928.1 DNA repair protein RecN [Clostridia bacterium]MBQ7052109.1 DNA repair protein RecN [Clostridia bacterium]